MDPDHLLQVATDLAETNPGRPRRTDLCRAVSTTYYAMFHCLARSCADRLAGRAGTVGNRPKSKRHFADYDPDYRVGKSEVVTDIHRARTAIDRFLATPANVRRDFALHVLTKVRPDT